MPPPSPDNMAPSSLALSSDSIRTCLTVLRDSADVFPPLKSAVGGVLAVWDLADRVSTSDENARALAWRAFSILVAIDNAVGGVDSGSISPGMSQEILKFAQLLGEISAAMEDQLKAARFFRRVLYLWKHESQLAGFTSQLDAASEAFKIGSSTRVELVVNRGELAVNRVGSAVNRVELTVDEIQADTSATAALAVVLEKSIIRLHGEVQRLRTVVLFGISPVFHGYSTRSTSWRRAGMPSYLKQGINYVRSSLNWGSATFLNAVAKTYSWKTQRRGSTRGSIHMRLNGPRISFFAPSPSPSPPPALPVARPASLRPPPSALPLLDDEPNANTSPTHRWIPSESAATSPHRAERDRQHRAREPVDQRRRRRHLISVTFYLITNVAVGGTNGWFPDGTEKPWLDGSATAPLDFLRAQDKWYKTWPQDPAERAMHQRTLTLDKILHRCRLSDHDEVTYICLGYVIVPMGPSCKYAPDCGLSSLSSSTSYAALPSATVAPSRSPWAPRLCGVSCVDSYPNLTVDSAGDAPHDSSVSDFAACGVSRTFFALTIFWAIPRHEGRSSSDNSAHSERVAEDLGNLSLDFSHNPLSIQSPARLH
ncbi:hypothetical protein DFH09DRAFT_1372965 [Mycena vulgaris]|nr:hypothetical protein DFH09DRAFT_1372965 [Mycena vulgaris]